MKKLSSVLLISILTLQGTGCTTSRVQVDYQSMGEESKVEVTEGAVNGRSLGIAKGDEGGAIWADCAEKAKDSLRAMLAQAKAGGANAVGDVKWYASGNSQPSCKKGWGYLIVWPFVLTPLFMSTAVEAHMYRLEGGRKSANLIMLPESRDAEEILIEKLVMGSK